MLFRKLNHLLAANTGFRISRIVSERRVVTDPRQAAYYNPHSPVGHAIKVPLALGLEFNAFSLGSTTYHPWVTAIRLSRSLTNEEIFRNVLWRYYSMVQPRTLKEWLDIPANVCPAIDSLPLFAWGWLPWTTRSPAEFVQNVDDSHFAENRVFGLNKGASAGEKAFGPVTRKKFEVEAQRVSSLFKSIKENGLDECHPDYWSISAMFLVVGDRWIWRSTVGMHRIAVACAAGIKHIEVRISAVVRREEVDIWPQVQSGLYDRETALALFDRLFARQPPRCVHSWIEWVDKQQFA